MPSPVVSVVRSLARQARGVARQIVRVPGKSMSKMSGEKRPNMAKMRQVTPVYDHDMQKWVWPTPPVVHQDDLAGRPCKKLSNSSRTASRRSSDWRTLQPSHTPIPSRVPSHVHRTSKRWKRVAQISPSHPNIDQEAFWATRRRGHLGRQRTDQRSTKRCLEYLRAMC